MRFKMMPSSSNGKSLDLSRLTDDEAKHVWQVIQRDFHLRQKEEDRLGELKTKIMKEDTKRELLEYQPKLSDSLCIRCLQPFKFLVNNKRQCLDCKLFVCKSCSRFNKKDRGWVCDPCHMSRILKIGTLEWFHENVRSRFKRFGSAKVMNSLFKRLNSDRASSQTDLREPRDDDTHSMPEVHTGSLFNQEDEQSERERAERRHFSLMRKGRRLLPVDPLEFNIGVENSAYSRTPLLLYSGSQEKVTQSKDSVNEDNWCTTFKQILENGTHGRGDEMKDMLQISLRSLDKPSHFDDCTPHLEQRMTKSRSLSKMSLSSAGSANYHLHRELSYSLEDSEDDDESEMNVIYSPALLREPSPDEVPPQIIELNKRMSSIETLLSRLEKKIAFPVIGGSTELVEQKVEDLSPADLEELELRKKLDELTEKISDKGLSSDEEDATKSSEDSQKKGALSHASTMRGASAGLGNVRHEWPLEVEWKAKPNIHKSLKKQKRVSSFEFSNTTSCELSQLEGKVAMAAASVQSTQSGVTDIQKRIAALSAAGMTVETSRRRAPQPSRVLHEFPIRSSNEAKSLRKLVIM
ncbi:hypothetical protein ABG768_027451 [Culter alburnus]|uniref:RabBD domain-containing protein n=1 Tax=Culter alburnus TaxID=194366 RepID=A0AAW2A874_CULAL